MNAGESRGKVLVVDSNLFFVKRLTEALRQQGFEVIHCSEPAYALTMIEWNTPAAILCASTLNTAEGFEIPRILRADSKTSHIPVIALGDRGQQSQLEALRAGYADLVDRRLGADEIAAHLTSLLSCAQDGFQPTQMLTRSETALDGRLSLVDLPGVIQVLSQSRQTGGLHINADTADGIIFFDAGEITHAESGEFAGDEAIVHLVKNCYLTKDGIYKFLPGEPPTLRTVQGTISALILDAMRELDEQGRDTPTESHADDDALVSAELETETQANTPPTNIEEILDEQLEPDPGEQADFSAEDGRRSEPAAEILLAAEPEGASESTETEEGAAIDGTFAEMTEEAQNPPEASDSAPVPHAPSGGANFIDEDALLELNTLVNNLGVEELESHE